MNSWNIQHLGAGLGLAIGLGLLLPSHAQGLPDNFGRWQSAVQRCRLSGGDKRPRSAACNALRLDQQLPGLLSVRFFNRSQTATAANPLLVFAGILERSSPAMACRAGMCERTGTMRSLVSALADQGFAVSGEASGLPRTRLVKGSCLIQTKRIRCDASEEGGPTWSAEADL